MSSWILNCAANLDTNGVDLKLTAGFTHVKTRRNMAKGDVVDNAAKSAVGLPSKFEPRLKTAGSNDALQSFILPDKKTGVVRFESLRYPAHVPADVVTNSKLFVGSFASGDFDGFQRDVAKIMQRFKDANLTQLIVDVTNNNGASLQWAESMLLSIRGRRLHLSRPFSPRIPHWVSESRRLPEPVSTPLSSMKSCDLWCGVVTPLMHPASVVLQRLPVYEPRKPSRAEDRGVRHRLGRHQGNIVLHPRQLYVLRVPLRL